MLHRAILLACALLASPALAHDSWINRNGLRNAAGEWCCGESDCAVLDQGAVRFTASGYAIHGFGSIARPGGYGPDMRERYDETVPAAEAQASPDGAFWRCKRPDGSRRCFFAPPGS